MGQRHKGPPRDDNILSRQKLESHRYSINQSSLNCMLKIPILLCVQKKKLPQKERGKK